LTPRRRLILYFEESRLLMISLLFPDFALLSR